MTTPLTAEALANARVLIEQCKLSSMDEPEVTRFIRDLRMAGQDLLNHIDHLHGLLGRARFWMHAAGPTHRIFVSYRDDCKAIDALLREHGIGREGDGTG